jgi:transposase InsO family protein
LARAHVDVNGEGSAAIWTPIGAAWPNKDGKGFSPMGEPEIFYTDQGSEFTSAAFTSTFAAAGVRISMDGRGRWMDKLFIERLWRRLSPEWR